MSVAPEFAPEVSIPARARRTSRSAWPDRTVDGNVITPSAFHRPADDRASDEDGVGGALRLRLVPGAGSGAAQTAPVAGGSASTPAVHLTVRGRLVLALVALAVSLVVVAGAWSGGSSGAGSVAPSSVPAQVVVHDGDTLWSIAAALAPSHDPRETVDQLRRINGLTSVALVPGQVLRTR